MLSNAGRGGAGRGWGGEGRGGSKKFKPIPALPRGAELKSCPISAPSPLRSEENLRGVKRGRTGQAEWEKIVIPSRE